MSKSTTPRVREGGRSAPSSSLAVFSGPGAISTIRLVTEARPTVRVGPRGRAGGAGGRRRAVVRGGARVAADRRLGVGLPVVAEVEVADGPDLAPADLDQVALDELAGVDEPRGDLVGPAAADEQD